jgi:hypothetical protein
VLISRSLIGLFFIWACLPDPLRAQTCKNPVACENALPGNTGWEISGSGDPSIQGFATDISVNVGQTVTFKIQTDASRYRLDIYRMGYYGGLGARKIASVNPSVSLPQRQPACLFDSATDLLDCGNWAASASWPVPSTATSGLYFADAIRTDTGGTSQIYFIVRNDASHSTILFQTSDETWAAYNDYGGPSLYGSGGIFDLNSRAFKVSYNRPYDTRNFEAATFLFNSEYPMIRWLESNGYDLSYFTSVDAVRDAKLIRNHKIYLTVGHDEYASGPRRAALESARDAGVNLAFFSGNEFFWKTRWENSIDGSNTPFRTLVCYKETYQGTGTTYQPDPTDPPTWTGTWRDPRHSPPADGGRPENALTGTLFVVNGPGDDNINLSIKVPAADGKMRFWRNTSIATLAAGQTATLPPGTLGYEWDADIDNGFRPAGLVSLSTSTYRLNTDLLLDYGATYGSGDATHHLSLYRARSGALVFGAGTIQWAWGLDSNHDNSIGPADIRMQQATLNLLADMGAQPTTLQPRLIAATQSTDSTPPTTTITSPRSGSTLQYGSPVTISGTASDSGGGVVGTVEISVDGGQTWHPASGREQWAFVWIPSISGTTTIMVRASDDSANLQTTPASISLSVSSNATCPCSTWSNSTVPGTPSASDPGAVELGMKFRSDTAGFITGIRFYKGNSNTGTHIGNLWTSTGTRLATATFTNETASGWQRVNFQSAVPISANTTYIASYYAPNGGYAADLNFFAVSGVDHPPLHALANGVDGGNGVFVYANGGGFPSNTFSATNYWVDPVFTLSPTWSISGTITGGGGATVALSGTATATVSADSSGNYIFTGLKNGSYTVTATLSGRSITPANRSVTVNGGNVTGVDFNATQSQFVSIWTDSTIPGTTSASDTSAVELGLKFKSDVDGFVAGVRFYKGANNTGTHIGSLWTSTGTKLASVTFTGETASGWQQATFSSSVPISAGVTYVASYFAPVGRYAADLNFFASSGVDRAPLHALSNGAAGGNGVYRYGSASGFPSNTFRAANYWVDVTFTPAAQSTSIWDSSTVPGTASQPDNLPVELGLKFRSDVAGRVTAVRFYKGANNTGTHIGHLWTSSGTRLGTVTFSGETASGWQQANFSSPISISANTTYIVSYYAPAGHYAADVGFFSSSGVDKPPLHALANGVDGGNGVYVYATGGGFPSNTFNSSNYWVDLVFVRN